MIRFSMFTNKPLKIIDISPEVSSSTAVFPGDIPFSRRVSMDFGKGDHLLLSSMETTLHIGAHADGPNHYSARGDGIAERDLSLYLGLCQVIEAGVPGERIYADALEGQSIEASRVLFKTNSYPNPEQWNQDFSSLSPELIEVLVFAGVLLVGIDTPSIDPFDSKSLESHAAVAKHDLAVLEGLVLKDVAPGLYDLIALPLKIKDADASPVRAILLESGSQVPKNSSRQVRR